MSLQRKQDEILNAVKAGMSNRPRVEVRADDEHRTAIGVMVGESHLRLKDKLEHAEAVAAEASSKLAKAEATGLIVMLDPNRVKRSKFADRHESAFADSKFAEFLEEIKQTGGNTEPAQVRPLEGDSDFDYELASGHRRHAACLKLSLPFKAIVRSMTDIELIQQMRRENAGREDLSGFELGRAYAAILTSGVYASERDMAISLNVPRTSLKGLLKFGTLPDVVIGAFRDPRTIRKQWVAPLQEAFSTSPTRLESTVTRIQDKRLSSTDVFRALCDVKAGPSLIASKDMVLGRIREIHGRPAVILFKDAPPELLERISKVVLDWAAANRVKE